MKDNEEISYSGPRPGVSMVTDKSIKTVVTLILALATMNDSGVYTCCPDYSRERLPLANITVNVLDGDKTAQLSGQFTSQSPGTTMIFLLLAMISFTDLS